MPPAPIGARISYGPRRVPGDRAISDLSILSHLGSLRYPNSDAHEDQPTSSAVLTLGIRKLLPNSIHSLQQFRRLPHLPSSFLQNMVRIQPRTRDATLHRPIGSRSLSTPDATSPHWHSVLSGQASGRSILHRRSRAQWKTQAAHCPRYGGQEYLLFANAHGSRPPSSIAARLRCANREVVRLGRQRRADPRSRLASSTRLDRFCFHLQHFLLWLPHQPNSNQLRSLERQLSHHLA